MKINFNILFLIIIFSAFLTNSCSLKFGYYKEDKKLAEKAVEQFHRLYNEQNYEELYNIAHEEAKATKSKEKLIELMGRIYADYGKVLDSTVVRADVSVLNAKERQVAMVCKTKFEKKEKYETFLVITSDEKANFHTYGEITEEELKNMR